MKQNPPLKTHSETFQAQSSAIPHHPNSNVNRAQRILMLSPEWGTVTKVGGLADVVTSLSLALMAEGKEVRVLLLGYRHVQMEISKKLYNPKLPYFLIEEATHKDYPGIIFYVLRHPTLESLYEPYALSYTAPETSLDLLQALLLVLRPLAINSNPQAAWRADIVHAHDWVCGLFPYLNLHAAKLFPTFQTRPTATILTLHNADYTGKFSIQEQQFFQWMQKWGMAVSPAFSLSDWRLGAEVNLLATGIRYATKLNTVSSTHAQELSAGDKPIERLLAAADFCGILNGVDYQFWSPEHDPYLQAHHYEANLSSLKRAKKFWKNELERQLQFTLDSRKPLFISICRIVKQKGLDALLNQEAILNAFRQDQIRFIILGEGDPDQESQIQQLAWKYPKQLHFLNYFHEEMAHLLTAGADFFWMPSRYEPCGLNQIYSLRYGTTPIVRLTGGLADTVEHQVTGLVYPDNSAEHIEQTLCEALWLWQHKYRQLWQMRLAAMTRDFSWQKSLPLYLKLYEEALETSARQTLQEEAGAL